jgi:dTMP kinase
MKNLMKKKFFIAIEGIDGSGKSTQIKLLKDNFESAGYKVYTTFEPTDSEIGKIIRNIFSNRMEADHRTIAALFVADRLHHLLNTTDGIIKKLKEGYTVITDRYYFSSYAYHSVHVDMDWVIASNSQSAKLLKPDLNIYIDIDPEISMKRINAGRDSTELYETLDNLEKVRGKYIEVFEKLKNEENILFTDGNIPTEIISRDIWENIIKLLL